MNVLFCSGEASGDAVAAALIHQLRQLATDTDALTFSGIGGPAFAVTGAERIADSSTFGAIGIVDALRIMPRAIRALNKCKAVIASVSPGVFVPIDYGYMNMKLCRHAKAHGWHVIYVNPPGSWRRNKQGQDLPMVTHDIVTPFSWSADILNQMGGQAHWFGHPIRQLMRESGRLDNAERTHVALLPGSRQAEVELLLPVMAKALQGVDTVAEFAIAPTIHAESIKRQWSRLAPDRTWDIFTLNDTRAVLKRARAGIICSGTATLEAALCRCPHVVAYKLRKITELQARLLPVKPKFISQPNILLDRMLVPELIQQNASPERLRQALLPLLEDGLERTEQLAGFEAIEALLGPEDAIDHTAQLILQRAQSMR